MSQEPGETLRAAAALIRERGWCRDTMSRNGRLCAVAAIWYASGRDDGDADAAQRELVRRLGGLDEQYPDPTELLFDWNDSAPDRRPILRVLEA